MLSFPVSSFERRFFWLALAKFDDYSSLCDRYLCAVVTGDFPAYLLISRGFISLSGEGVSILGPLI